MSAFRILIFYLVLILGLQASAEYRVFRLKITRTPALANPSAADNPAVVPLQTSTNAIDATQDSAASTPPAQFEDSRVVESTLDPDQYPGYYAIQANEKVEMVTTWRCFGRTDEFKSFCPNPKEQNLTLQKPSESPGNAP